MLRKWELIKVGLFRPEWKGKQEGLSAQWSDEYGLVLSVLCNNPRDEEMESMIINARLELTFKDVDGIGFFAVKFGNMDWSDCPFAANIYLEKPEYEEISSDKKYMLHVLLIDTSEGVLKLFRSINMDNDFATNFLSWCRNTVDNEFDAADYSAKVVKAYNEYPASEDLAKNADFRWLVAHGEDEKLRETLQIE